MNQMNQVIRQLPVTVAVAVAVILGLGACALFGCQNTLKAPTAPSPVTGAELSRCVPPLPPGFEAKRFLQGKDIVTYHVYKGTRMVATICLQDISGERSPGKSLFDGTTERFRGYPVISTAMGGGKAVLVANRFRVEVASMDPDVGEKRRDAWLSEINYDHLTGLGNLPVH